MRARLDAAGVPNTKAYTAADCAGDEQFRSRGMVCEVDDPGLGKVLQAGVVPHFPGNRHEVRWAGPEIGEHGVEILKELGLAGEAIARLQEDGVTI